MFHNVPTWWSVSHWYCWNVPMLLFSGNWTYASRRSRPLEHSK